MKIPTFATVARGAQAIAKDCQTAQDLWQEGDVKGLFSVMESISESAAILAKQASDMHSAYKQQFEIQQSYTPPDRGGDER